MKSSNSTFKGLQKIWAYHPRNLSAPGVRSPIEIPTILREFIEGYTLVDLGCCRGDLSIGFALYAKKVYGIEYSNIEFNRHISHFENIELVRGNYYEDIKNNLDHVRGDFYYVWGYDGCPFSGKDSCFEENIFKLANHIKKHVILNNEKDNRVIFSFSADISEAAKWPFDYIIPFSTIEKPVKKITGGWPHGKLCIVGVKFENALVEKIWELYPKIRKVLKDG